MLPVLGKACDHCAKRHIADLVRSAKADVPLSDTTPLCHTVPCVHNHEGEVTSNCKQCPD